MTKGHSPEGLKKPLATETIGMTDRCDRCGGIMVPAHLDSLNGEAWRCVSCGELVDPLILAHRRRQARRANRLARQRPDAGILHEDGPGRRVCA
jgi:hypothetical protein